MRSKLLGGAIAALATIPSLALAEGRACELTTPAEIQALVGAKPNLKGSTLPNGVEVCSGKAGQSTVTIRLHPRQEQEDREKEAARLDSLKKQGAMVETRRMSGINCFEIRPGGKAARQPYTTSCATASTSKAPTYAVIEVSSPSTSIDIKQLVPVAQGMAGRIY